MKKINNITAALRELNLWMKVFWSLFAVMIAFFISLAISPVHKMKNFEDLVRSDTLFFDSFDGIYDHPQMRPLVKEKIFKEALLKLAESDSIQMVVDLSDSTVNLSIKGVIIHRTKARKIETDRFFRKMPLIQQAKVFSSPLNVQSQFATIVKEPVVVRHAPKDTQEAALNAWMPDTLIQNPAFVCFSVEYGLDLIFEQEENPTFHDHWRKFSFYSRLRFQKAVRAVPDFVLLRKQEYHPTITMDIPVDDLRAVYRALPGKALVVINLR